MFSLASPLRISPFRLQPAEIWRPIPGFSGYEASSRGRIRNAATGRVLKASVGSHGYRQLKPRADSGRATSVAVHELVCSAFHGPRPDGLEVDHVNGDVFDNATSNLEWVSPRENKRRAVERGLYARGSRLPHTRLTESDVRELRSTTFQYGGLSAWARDHGVTVQAARQARIGKAWRHVG